MLEPKVVLDEDDVRRTLVRIAHEIVEKNSGRAVALVGIHRRGAHLAKRVHRLVCDLMDARFALRFEVYLEGIELANGFEELVDADEQQARFERDVEERARRGLPRPAVDPLLLAALRSGMPPCWRRCRCA